MALWYGYCSGYGCYYTHSITAPIRNPAGEPEPWPCPQDFEWGHITMGTTATTGKQPVTQTHWGGSTGKAPSTVPPSRHRQTSHHPLAPIQAHQTMKPPRSQPDTLQGLRPRWPSQHQEGLKATVLASGQQLGSFLPESPGGHSWRHKDPTLQGPCEPPSLGRRVTREGLAWWAGTAPATRRLGLLATPPMPTALCANLPHTPLQPTSAPPAPHCSPLSTCCSEQAGRPALWIQEYGQGLSPSGAAD